jgi:hypothetical protein
MLCPTAVHLHTRLQQLEVQDARNIDCHPACDVALLAKLASHID